MALRAVPDHPKFTHLKETLNQPKGPVLGWLEAIWHFTGRFTPQGNIGKYGNHEIEAWVEWNGKPGELISGLIHAGWIDEDATYRLLIHDWHQHADKATRMALKRAKLNFCSHCVPTVFPRSGHTEDTPLLNEGTEYGLPVPVPVPVPVPKTKASPKAPPVAFEVPEWIPREAWDAWIEVRRKKRAANTERALNLAVRELDKLRADGDSPEAVLNQSTMRSWTGLFPVKRDKVATPPPQPKVKTQYELAAEAQRQARQAAMREAGIQ